MSKAIIESKKKVVGDEPELIEDRAPYNHMAEYGRYEEGSPVAVEVEKNMRAIRNRIKTPPKNTAEQDELEPVDKEEFMEAAKRRIQITISVDV